MYPRENEEDSEKLKMYEGIIRQVEYYFGDHNLLKWVDAFSYSVYLKNPTCHVLCKSKNETFINI